jgi:hypothetical protein
VRVDKGLYTRHGVDCEEADVGELGIAVGIVAIAFEDRNIVQATAAGEVVGEAARRAPVGSFIEKIFR